MNFIQIYIHSGPEVRQPHRISFIYILSFVRDFLHVTYKSCAFLEVKGSLHVDKRLILYPSLIFQNDNLEDIRHIYITYY